jgi:hypothetical protein
MFVQKSIEVILCILNCFIQDVQTSFSTGDTIGELLCWYIVSLRDADITLQRHLPPSFFLGMFVSTFESESDSEYELILSRVAREGWADSVDMMCAKMVHRIESAGIDLYKESRSCTDVVRDVMDYATSLMPSRLSRLATGAVSYKS